MWCGLAASICDTSVEPQRDMWRMNPVGVSCGRCRCASVGASICVEYRNSRVNGLVHQQRDQAIRARADGQHERPRLADAAEVKRPVGQHARRHIAVCVSGLAEGVSVKGIEK